MATSAELFLYVLTRTPITVASIIYGLVPLWISSIMLNKSPAVPYRFLGSTNTSVYKVGFGVELGVDPKTDF